MGKSSVLTNVRYNTILLGRLTFGLKKEEFILSHANLSVRKFLFQRVDMTYFI